jgi:hypothetical protein
MRVCRFVLGIITFVAATAFASAEIIGLSSAFHVPQPVRLWALASILAGLGAVAVLLLIARLSRLEGLVQAVAVTGRARSDYTSIINRANGNRPNGADPNVTELFPQE